MNKKIRRVLFILGVGSGGILLLYQVYQGGLAISLTQTAFSSTIWLLAALFSALLMNLLQVFNWWNLMIGLGVKIDLLEAYRGYFLSFLPRYIPGTVWGYASRNEWLAQTHQIPAVITTTGSALEIIVALLTAVLIVGLYGITSGTGIPPFLALGGILLLPWATWLPLKTNRENGTAHSGAQTIFPCLIPIFSGRPFIPRWSASILSFLFQWLFYGLSVFFTASFIRSAGAEWPTLFTASTFAISLAWSVGFLILFVPGGMGIREWILAGLLGITWGFSTGEAAAASVIVRLVVSTGEIIWIMIGILLRTSNRSRRKEIV